MHTQEHVYEEVNGELLLFLVLYWNGKEVDRLGPLVLTSSFEVEE